MKVVNKTLDTGYKPRPLQAELHKQVKRFNVLVCHRRFGKTVFGANEIIDQGYNLKKRNPQYAYIAPTYGQAKRVAWDMFKQFTSCFQNRRVYEQDLKIEIPLDNDRLFRVMLLGAENPDSLKGLYLDGVILDEYASMFPSVWAEVIRPTLSDRLGWATFVGTPKGTNDFKEKYDFAADRDDWFRQIYRASETGIIPQTELDSARDEMGEETYMQEYECDWGAALIGAYYGKQMSAARKDGRITMFPYQPGAPVVTAWDLGLDDSTAIWFAQSIGREMRIIDYIEDSNQDLDHYAKYIKEQGYVYDEHFLPHDASHREIISKKSRIDHLRSLNIGRITLVPKHSPEDRIDETRKFLAKCVFQEKDCMVGIKALENYQRRWDSKQKVFVNKPLHNWASHGADAFGTLAMGFRGDTFERNKKLPRKAKMDYDIFNSRGF